MFGFRNENVLQMKIGYFRKLCLTNCGEILNFVTLKWGYQTLTGHPTVFFEKFTDYGK